MEYPKNHYDQIDRAIEMLQEADEYKDLTPFESYSTSIGELNEDGGHNYQLQIRIVRMESRQSMDVNDFRKEEITKFVD